MERPVSEASGLNQRIADRLRRAADLLEAQGDNPFRVRAYRRAAETVAGLDRGLDSILAEGGRAALEALPGIGPSLSRPVAAPRAASIPIPSIPSKRFSCQPRVASAPTASALSPFPN